MRIRLGTAAVVVLLGCCVWFAWRRERLPELPPHRPQMADMGTIKSDLIAFAAAERAFYASSGHYAAMSELRGKGLLTLPPDTRWPYSYYIAVPAPGKFFVVAVSEGLPGGRPVAMAMNEDMVMRKFDPRELPGPHRRHGRPVRRSIT